jgi:hypothetical protein
MKEEKEKKEIGMLLFLILRILRRKILKVV